MSFGNFFYVTLPSNASHNVYPQNTNGKYITKLDRRLHLEGGQWEVGMTSIQFVKSWFNLTDGAVSWLQKAGGDNPDNLYFKEYARVEPNLYTNVGELSGAIYSAIYNTELRNRVTIRTIQYKNRIRIDLDTDGGRYRKLQFSDQLSQILGLAPNTAIDSESVETTVPPNIEGGTLGLNIYSNVVANRAVGNSMLPLLRSIPSSMTSQQPFRNINIEFNNVHYVEAANFNEYDVEIRIEDDFGKVVDFTIGKVVISLHFRRISK